MYDYTLCTKITILKFKKTILKFKARTLTVYIVAFGSARKKQ